MVGQLRDLQDVPKFLTPSSLPDYVLLITSDCCVYCVREAQASWGSPSMFSVPTHVTFPYALTELYSKCNTRSYIPTKLTTCVIAVACAHFLQCYTAHINQDRCRLGLHIFTVWMLAMLSIFFTTKLIRKQRGSNKMSLNKCIWDPWALAGKSQMSNINFDVGMWRDTRSSTIANGPRDVLWQSKSYQLLHNSRNKLQQIHNNRIRALRSTSTDVQ